MAFYIVDRFNKKVSSAFTKKEDAELGKNVINSSNRVKADENKKVYVIEE